MATSGLSKAFETNQKLKEKFYESHRFKRSWQNTKAIVKRGNLLILAIGILLGNAFNAVLTSLATNVISASLSKLFNVDQIREIKINGIEVGLFLANLISFSIIIIVVTIFLVTLFYIKEVILDIKKKKIEKIEAELNQENSNEAERKQEKVSEPVLDTNQLILNQLKENNELLKEQIALLKDLKLKKEIVKPIQPKKPKTY